MPILQDGLLYHNILMDWSPVPQSSQVRDLFHICSICSPTSSSLKKFRTAPPCMGCFSYKFPTHKLVRFSRSEEMAVLDAVYTRFVDEGWAHTMVHDRSIEGACSQKRPDMFVDLGTHILIVEVDEYQHKRGDYSSCDNMRTMTLFQDAGSRPTVFLRFNPHGYVAANGVAVPSPWTKTKTEQRPRVIDKHRTEWEARLQRLFERIEYWTQLEDFPTKEVTVEFLFYDASDSHFKSTAF